MNRPVVLIVSALLALVAGWILVAFIGYQASQIGGASPVGANPCGILGAHAANLAIRSWGVAAFLVPLVMLGWAYALYRGWEMTSPGRRLTGAVLLIPAAAGLIHLVPRGNLAESLLGRWDQSNLEGLGGAVGWLLCAPAASYLNPSSPGGLLVRLLEAPGAAVILVALALLGIGLMQLGVGRMVRRSFALVRERFGRQPADEASAAYIPPVPPRKERPTTSVQDLQRIASSAYAPAQSDDEAERLIALIRSHRQNLEQPTTPGASANPTNTSEPGLPAGAPPNTEAPATVATTTAAAAVPAAPAPAVPRPPAPEGSVYVLPAVDLLDTGPERKDAQHDQERHQTAKAIEEVFSHFSIDVQVVASQRGPVVTQYEIRLLDQAMRVNKVEGFEKDLAMKLGTEGIRIIAPLPNKTTVGIEVPNKVKQAVVMRDLVEECDPDTMALPIVLGRDAVGGPLIADLAKMPHLLVAGSTGMGKSVCMNAMICSILLFRRPDEVKFIMVDPKMVELAGYEDIPHLLAPPITDMTRAHAALEWACKEMDLRYEALKATGCRNIGDFNALGGEEMAARLAKKGSRVDDLECRIEHDRMPFIVVLVDEYADLMMVNKEVEKSIVRLAAKSRACGIHVILTTQRPSADVVTGLIKSNLPSRICFRVVDKNNSRVVLDISGAENLLGKGDMLFLQPGTSFPVRGQGVWLKDAEIAAIVDHAKAQGSPNYDQSISEGNPGAVAMAGGESSGSASGDAWKTDRGFHEAVQAMYRYDKTGADFFRRKMGIGYNKATAYVEQLEELGFLSPANGSAARKILKSWDDWLDLLKENGIAITEDDDLYHSPFPVSG